MAFDVNSVPLSETIMPGLPRRLINAVGTVRNLVCGAGLAITL
jgi:hypothetical protein